jgi:pimeloyl-ACP methyl ester carboxylesterase
MTTTQTLTELYVHESGSPGAPAIVFLHPTAANGGMWNEHMRRLVGYHCLAPDLPGHGRSNHLPWTSLDDTAQQVAALIEDRVPARRAHVVGLSLGGALVHKLLAHRPELLDRVVIDGCGGGVLPARGAGLWKLAFALTAPLLHRKLVIGLLYRYLGGDPSDPAGRARFAADLRAVSPAAFRRSFADANDNKNRFSREELSALCPILLVAGEREPGTIRASNAALAALMPNATARFVPGAGHAWLTRAPELHVRMVEAWISGQELPAGLAPETTPWPSSQVQPLLDTR